jgi:membrane protease YdiL (CAAX protease family)
MRVHPLIRLTLFALLYVIGIVLTALPLFILLSIAAGGLDILESEISLLPVKMPVGFFMLISWPGFLFNLVLAAVFHAAVRVDPLLGLRRRGGGVGRELAIGLALGLGSMAVVAFAFVMLGWVSFFHRDLDDVLFLLAVAVIALVPVAASEEIAFRGYVLPVVESWLGWWPAVAVSSILFGLTRAVNANATPLALANSLLAGVVFALAYGLIRRLWLPIAYHFGWMLGQCLLGLSVSGMALDALWHTSLSGPELWTGGVFGPEGGLVVTLVLLATCGSLMAYQRGRFNLPDVHS